MKGVDAAERSGELSHDLDLYWKESGSLSHICLLALVRFARSRRAYCLVGGKGGPPCLFAAFYTVPARIGDFHPNSIAIV